MDGNNDLEKNKAGTRGGVAVILIRAGRKGLIEKVAFEQGSVGTGEQAMQVCKEKAFCAVKT